MWQTLESNRIELESVGCNWRDIIYIYVTSNSIILCFVVEQAGYTPKLRSYRCGEMMITHGLGGFKNLDRQM